MIINADPDGIQTALIWSQMRVPVRCVVNDDPMLVYACVVQVGQGVVSPSSLPKLELSEAKAACAKIAVYRDCVGCSWQEFCQAPVRYVLDHLVALQICKEADGCKCDKWHEGSSGIRDPVLDVWRRQWVSVTFKNTSQENAEIFLVNLRYSQEAEAQVLGASGCHGLFIEPRSLDGKQPIHDWQVVWLHRMQLKEVMRIKQCNPHVVGAARLGSRFGVRVHVDHVVEVGAAIKPEAVIIAAGRRMDFELGPIPFGYDRAAVQSLCQKWKWQARAVNPIRTFDGQAGTMWHVQAACEPPSTLVSTQQRRNRHLKDEDSLRCS